VGLVLLATRQLRHSFADYAEWEARALAEAGASPTPAPLPEPQKVVPGAGPTGTAADAEFWIQYPHARREMWYELLFLAPCLGLGMLGWYLGKWFGPADGSVPLWVVVFSGVCLGYLVGGGVVWAVRILGSLAFGKEAMGLGDVHMMAAVGACLGWADATIAFFLAAPVALIIIAITRFTRGSINRTLPFGPSLAIATVLVVLGKSLIEAGLSWLLHSPINLA
jgi:hypothetical protein